jgi:hypothetical protein
MGNKKGHPKSNLSGFLIEIQDGFAPLGAG